MQNIGHRYKQAIILRTDLSMSTGKKVAQGCHAAVIAAEESRRRSPELFKAWTEEGQKKIALKVGSDEELIACYHRAQTLGLPCTLIQDAGLTELEPGTRTAVGIGPARAEDVDKITGSLKLL